MRQIDTVNAGPQIICDLCAREMETSLRAALAGAQEALGLTLDADRILAECMGEDVTLLVPSGQTCDQCGAVLTRLSAGMSTLVRCSGTLSVDGVPLAQVSDAWAQFCPDGPSALREYLEYLRGRGR
jgi:hypothetical protein